jgi:hypothetical protein
MKLKYTEPMVAWMKEQVFEAKEDLSIYEQLSDFEHNQYKPFLPPAAKVIMDLGSGLGRGAVKLSETYKESHFICADRTGKTQNAGILFQHGGGDEFYNDLSLTKEFCTLNGIKSIEVFDTEKDDWSSLPQMDLIVSRCSFGFHLPIDKYLNKLIKASAPEVTMIFGVNGLYVHTDYYSQFFKEVNHIDGLVDDKFPYQKWLIFKGLK